MELANEQKAHAKLTGDFWRWTWVSSVNAAIADFWTMRISVCVSWYMQLEQSQFILFLKSLEIVLKRTKFLLSDFSSLLIFNESHCECRAMNATSSFKECT